MWIVAELFEQLPEIGDRDKPRLVFFLDEAHLLFDGASKAFVESVTQTVRLIRSKGVGVFFVTQTPKDIPADVLGQLGNRVQHALRAFTPDDAKALRATVRDVPQVRLLRPRGAAHADGDGRGRGHDPVRVGVPTPVVHTRMRPPHARMGPADDVDGTAKSSPLYREVRARGSTARARGDARCATRARCHLSRRAATLRAPEEGSRGDGRRCGRDRRLPQVLDREAIQRELVRGLFGLLKKRI